MITTDRIAELYADRKLRSRLIAMFKGEACPACDEEDLVQEVFVRLLGLRERLEDRCIYAYILRIAQTVLRDCRKRRARWHECELLHEGEEEGVEELAPLVALYMSHLSDEEREIVAMSALGYTVREIAQTTGRSDAAVRWAINKMRDRKKEGPA